MPRQYTQRRIVQSQIAAADDWNKEINSAGAEINGQLDQNQMPLSTFGDSTFTEPTVVVDYDGTLPGYPGWRVTHSYGQSQSYHVSKHCGPVPDQEPYQRYTVWPPSLWTLGWIKVSGQRFVYDGSGYQYPGSLITFDAQEGMVVGEVMVDAEWRINYKYNVQTPISDPPIYNRWYLDGCFIEVGAFVNDICVGRTDEQWLGGRFTYVVPFSVPVGTQTTTIDIRFRLIQKKYEYFQDSTNVLPGLGDPVNVTSDFVIYDSMIWARNQYR